MKKILTYPIALALLISSCKKKDLPESELTQPEFTASFDVQGNTVKLEAGNNDYYMNSSYGRDSLNNLYVYKADLRQRTFQMGGGYALTILFNDTKATALNSGMKVDSALSLGDHLYNDLNTAGLTQRVNFDPLMSNDQASDYAWSFTDGSSVKTYNGSYAIAPNLEVGKTYSVTFNYTAASGVCSAAHTNVFKAGSKVQTTITASKDTQTSELKYNLGYSIPSNYGPATWRCRWEFDNNTTSTSPTISGKLFQPGIHLIKLTLTDKAVNDSCVSFYQLNATSGNACEANYKATFLPIQNNRVFSSVTLLLTDPNGVVYTSHDLVQPASSSFQILSVNDYKTNDAGLPTKSLKVKFNCVLKNGNSQITLTNGEAVVAIAYK